MLEVLKAIVLLIAIGVPGLMVLRRLTSALQRRDRGAEPTASGNLGVAVAILVGGLLVFFALTGATQVPATHVAVVENTFTGQFFSLGPGTHIFPFEPRLWPLTTVVTKYDLRRQIIEIGAPPAGSGAGDEMEAVMRWGVEADSNSPGRPIVRYHARGWAYPNQDEVIELHRRYGLGYADRWVERVWISALKAVQGRNPYDYVGNNRIQMQDEIEQALQEQLLAEDGEPIVIVSQLAVVNFGYDPNMESYLDSVAQKEFERQQAEQQILINEKQQNAAKIEADTNYIVTVRRAEAERAQRIAQAEGQAQAQKTLADAEAYSIRAKYEAEAEGIKLVQEAIARSPEYLTYQQQEAWAAGGAQVPNTLIVGLEGAVPFLNLLPGMGEEASPES
jgi:regulator of protease activity HflC (stomatin/prohibitin superfamily)